MQTNKIAEISLVYLRQYLDLIADPIDPDRPLPFEDFYLLFTSDARQKLNYRSVNRQLE